MLNNMFIWIVGFLDKATASSSELIGEVGHSEE